VYIHTNNYVYKGNGSRHNKYFNLKVFGAEIQKNLKGRAKSLPRSSMHEEREPKF
jgi:hypothetical protein